MNKYCLALDLKDDPSLIAEYENHHLHIWPEILESIKRSGVEKMEIYRIQNRLFMIMEVSEDFSLEKKAITDAGNAKVQEWEELMWTYQQALPNTLPGEKWVLMTRIFDLSG